MRNDLGHVMAIVHFDGECDLACRKCGLMGLGLTEAQAGQKIAQHRRSLLREQRNRPH